MTTSNHQPFTYPEGKIDLPVEKYHIPLFIYSPEHIKGKKISLIDTDSEEPSLKKINSSYPFVKEMMSYYQDADYVLKNRLNRWSDERADRAANKK